MDPLYNTPLEEKQHLNTYLQMWFFFKKNNKCIITSINVSENQGNTYKGLGGIILYSPRFTAFKGHTFHSWLVGSLFWF